MRALSIRQPWAWAILHAGKRIENREWRYPPSYRGPLLIHAAKGCTRDELESAELTFKAAGAVVPSLASMPRGALVATARLVGARLTTLSGHAWDRGRCVWCDTTEPTSLEQVHGRRLGLCAKKDPWAVDGALGLLLADVRPLPEPIPWKGELGLFEVPDRVLQGIDALGGAS